jgi:hypothetical protein
MIDNERTVFYRVGYGKGLSQAFEARMTGHNGCGRQVSVAAKKDEMVLRINIG